MKINFMLFFLFGIIFGQNEVCFEIEENPNPNDPALGGFTKYVNVLDCIDIYGESSIPDYKILHVAAVAAELLDNDEDGIVDDSEVEVSLRENETLMPVFLSENSNVIDDFFDHYEGCLGAVLFRNEIDPTQPGHWGDDATVEEVLHTINNCGQIPIYPDVFGLDPNSSLLSDAMDVARGGQFLTIPDDYPEEAWYHYDDWTCEYDCMAIEYLYWCIVSYMGILDDPQTCLGISDEWELCTPELFEEIDILMYSILTDPEYKLPQHAPDGNYCPNIYLNGDVNFDESINVLDVVLVINFVLEIADPTEEQFIVADMNEDGMLNVLDIVQIVNLILYDRGLGKK